MIEDAWFRHDDLFGSKTGLQLGQFQISDLMFPRETRMTFQDFMAYRMAGITYDRGLLLDRRFDPVKAALGFVNGNGINANFNVNSPGYRRPDKLFDNDSRKTVFGRLGSQIGPVSFGLFALDGKQKNATGPAGTASGTRDTTKRILGLDLSGEADGRWYWFAQRLWNRWDDFLDEGRRYRWFGAFAGVDDIASDRWVFSFLANYADAGDLAHTDTIYEGIDIRTLTFSASDYFMRNVKAIIELNADLLDKAPKTGTYYTGHLTREHYLLIGLDAAF